MLSGWLIMLAITFSRSGQIMQILPFLVGIIALLAVITFIIKKRANPQVASEV
jgi:DcuC family C4-dicarboxylate transporter